jgi:hypothetical protein
MPRNSVVRKSNTKLMPKQSAREQQAAAKHTAPTGVQQGHTPVEPEEAYLTGANRAEQQKWLEKNVTQGQAQQHPDTPAGQHATGSFTGENKQKKK